MIYVTQNIQILYRFNGFTGILMRDRTLAEIFSIFRCSKISFYLSFNVNVQFGIGIATKKYENFCEAREID
jgi:hypothetical protein